MKPRDLSAVATLLLLPAVLLGACTTGSGVDADAERTRLAATIFAEQFGEGAGPSGPQPASTRVPTSPPAPSPTPTAAPVPAGFPVPVPPQAISLANVEQVQQLAFWGSGAIQHIFASPQEGIVAVATSLGLDVYRGAGLEPLTHLTTGGAVIAAAASGTADALAYLIGEELTVARLSSGETLAVTAYTREGSTVGMRFSPDGGYLAIWESGYGGDGSIRLFAAPDWEWSQSLSVGWGPVLDAVFSHHSEYLAASGGDPMAVHVWSLPDGSLVEKIDEWYLEDMQGLFSPTAPVLVEHDYGEFILRDLVSGLPAATLPDPPLLARDRAFSPDGRFIYFAGSEADGYAGLLLAWDPETGEHRQLPVDEDVDDLAISPDGRTLAGVTRDETIHIWAAGGLELRPLGQIRQPRIDRILVTDDDLLIGITNDQVIHAWTVTDRQLVRTIGGVGLAGALSDVAFSSNGAYVGAGAEDGNVAVWRAANGEILFTAPHGEGGGYGGLQVGFSHDERTFVAVDSGAVGRWMLPDGEARSPLPLLPDDDSSGPTYSAALVDTADELILMMNGTTYRQEDCLGGGGPFGRSATTRLDTLSVRVAGDLTVRREFACLTTDARRALLIPDGSLLLAWTNSAEPACQSDPFEVVSLYGRTTCIVLPTPTVSGSEPVAAITVWSWDGGAPLRTVAVDGSPYLAAWEPSPDGSYLALRAFENIDVLDLSTWELIQRISLPSLSGCAQSADPLCYEADRVLAFSADESLIAAGVGPDIGLWDLRSGEMVQTLSGHLGPVTALDFSTDGRLLASASEDGTVRLWGVR